MIRIGSALARVVNANPLPLRWRANVVALVTMTAADGVGPPGGQAGGDASVPPRLSITSDEKRLPVLKVDQKLSGPGQTSGVIWTRDGKKLAAWSYGRSSGIPSTPLYSLSPFGTVITIWNADGSVFCQIGRERPFFDVQDSFAFVAGDKEIVAPPPYSKEERTQAFSVLDAETGEVIREVSGTHPDQYRNVNGAKRIVASPDQSIVAMTFGLALPQQVGLYSTRDWSRLPELPEGAKNAADRPDSLAFSEDGRFLAAGRGGKIFVYDIATTQLVRKIDSFSDIRASTGSLAFNPDGTMIAAGLGGLNSAGAVRVFRVSDGSRLALFPEKIWSISSMAWSRKGTILAFIIHYRTLCLFIIGRCVYGTHSAQKKTSKRSISRASDSLAFSPDGKKLAVAVGSGITIYTVEH
jgi:WD40 repeat protein